MSEWSEFTSALLAFFVLHSLPVRPEVKTRIVVLIGARLFTLTYSAISIVALSWLIVAAARAPYVELWPAAPWQHLVVLVVMFGACLTIAFALGRPNPFSFGGSSRTEFNPDRAGIVRLNRHPLLLAFLLWAAAHLLANGDLAHLILFGLFAGFSVLGMLLINRRKQRQLGPVRYEIILNSMRQTPVLRGFAHDHPVIRSAAGLGLYVTLLLLHPLLLGVSPIAILY